MSWTDERVESLKKLWGEGLSASQIAGRLGGVTRTAVLGKVHRLGRTGRAAPTRIKTARPRARVGAGAAKRQAKPRFAQLGNPSFRNLYQPDAEPFVPAAAELEIPLAERKTLQMLTESCCRWPIGDPQNADFHFCNGSKVAGLPYCEFHARRAFQPPQSRARRDGQAGEQRHYLTSAPAPKAKVGEDA